MNIGGLQKLTILDYPGKTACIVFTKGCNYRCPFCHNSHLVNKSFDMVLEEEVFSYIEKRRNLLDGVVITGGEPLLQKDIERFIRRIKDLGYLIKLDTNGTFPDKLDYLIKNELIDYVAMDIKRDIDNYGLIVGVNNPLVENIKKSIEILKSAKIEHEFRTTVVKEHHDYKVLESICKYIGKDELYYLQNYQESDSVLKKGLTSFSKSELETLEKKLKETYPLVSIRSV